VFSWSKLFFATALRLTALVTMTMFALTVGHQRGVLHRHRPHQVVDAR
jgi:hypothetical protein